MVYPWNFKWNPWTHSANCLNCLGRAWLKVYIKICPYGKLSIKPLLTYEWMVLGESDLSVSRPVGRRYSREEAEHASELIWTERIEIRFLGLPKCSLVTYRMHYPGSKPEKCLYYCNMLFYMYSVHARLFPFQRLDIPFHLFESTSLSITSLSIQSRGIITQMLIPGDWRSVWGSPGGSAGLAGVSIVRTAGETIYWAHLRKSNTISRVKFCSMDGLRCFKVVTKQSSPFRFKYQLSFSSSRLNHWCYIERSKEHFIDPPFYHM